MERVVRRNALKKSCGISEVLVDLCIQCVVNVDTTSCKKITHIVHWLEPFTRYYQRNYLTRC